MDGGVVELQSEGQGLGLLSEPVVLEGGGEEAEVVEGAEASQHVAEGEGEVLGADVDVEEEQLEG